MTCFINKEELTENFDKIIETVVFNSPFSKATGYEGTLEDFIVEVYDYSLNWLPGKTIGNEEITKETAQKKSFTYACNAVSRAYSLLTSGSFSGKTSIRKTEEFFPLFNYDRAGNEDSSQQNILNHLLEIDVAKSIVAKFIDTSNLGDIRNIDICLINEQLNNRKTGITHIKQELLNLKENLKSAKQSQQLCAAR